ncbi:MAG: choice-of-anchor Q domain-containing protein [Pirellulales bacterium]
MNSLSSGWHSLRARLGLTSKKPKARAQRNQFGRRLRIEPLERRQLLAVIVDMTTDESDGSIVDGDVSLRDAIDRSNAGETINFASSLNGLTISLTLGEIAFGKNLTIDASSLQNGITISAGHGTDQAPNTEDGFRIFNITDTSQPAGTSPPLVTMKGLTLTGADSNPNLVTQGGAIRSAAMLVLDDMIIEGNHAYSGAGVYLDVAEGGSGNRDVLKIINGSMIENNDASYDGGGVYVKLNSTTGAKQTVHIVSSTISDNDAGLLTASGRGGALFIIGNSAAESRSAVMITGSELELNTAGHGGAIYHSGKVDLSILQESSVSGNDALYSGGGIYSYIFGSHLRIEDSIVSGNDAVGVGNNHGGGVFALLEESASLSIVDSEVSGNTALQDGGGVYANAQSHSGAPFPTPRAVTVSRSLISGNTASRGGGLYTYNAEGTETLVEESHITGNQVNNLEGFHGNGGGVYAYLHGFNFENIKPRFIITRSTVDNNEADNKAGGIFVCCKKFGHFIATNSTFSGNSTVNDNPLTAGGGGIVIARDSDFPDGSIDADLRNLTVTQNTSVNGGGILIADLSNMRVRIANSIISENENLSSQPNNLVGRVVDEVFKHNLVGTGSTIEDENSNSPTLDSTNKLNEDDPGLGALADNGGPTPTHALRFGSLAIDQGSVALASDPLTSVAFPSDQRGTGFARSYDFPGVTNSIAGFVDIGAYELTEICVSTLVDEFDTDLSFGDLSLREAVNYANLAGVPMTVCLPAGVYYLTLTGTGGISQGDLDISGNVTIVGDGAGLSVIDAGGLATDDRIFDIVSGGTLDLSRLTLTLGLAPNTTGQRDGGAIRVNNGGHLGVSHSAIVGNVSGRSGDGGAIYFGGTASGSIESSVITVNEGDDNTGGVYLASATGTGGTVTVTNTIIAKNTDDGGSGGTDVYAGTNRSFTSGINGGPGNNRLGNAATGFTDGLNGDYIGTPDYIVTSLADTYDGSSDPVGMSLRDAIHQANQTIGAQEIWLPAWDFVLTRERTAAANSPEMDISQGDLDIKGSLTIRGIGTATSVQWKPGVVDKVFELVGDYNGDGVVDSGDYTVWFDTQGSTTNLSADGDDDGDVDGDDEDVWGFNFGHTLVVWNVSVILPV